MMGLCVDCRNWARHEADATKGTSGRVTLARCVEDKTLASPPLMWGFESCNRFAPELMPYPHQTINGSEEEMP
jgi:hypothetical protein